MYHLCLFEFAWSWGFPDGTDQNICLSSKTLDVRCIRTCASVGVKETQGSYHGGKTSNAHAACPDFLYVGCKNPGSWFSKDSTLWWLHFLHIFTIIPQKLSVRLWWNSRLRYEVSIAPMWILLYSKHVKTRSSEVQTEIPSNISNVDPNVFHSSVAAFEPGKDCLHHGAIIQNHLAVLLVTVKNRKMSTMKHKKSKSTRNMSKYVQHIHFQHETTVCTLLHFDVRNGNSFQPVGIPSQGSGRKKQKGEHQRWGHGLGAKGWVWLVACFASLNNFIASHLF